MDEEFLGSFAAVSASLISFCRKAELQVYIRIAEALENLNDQGVNPSCPIVCGIKEVDDTTEHLWDYLSEGETMVATQLVRDHILVGIPRRSNPEVPNPTPAAMTLPKPRILEDYTIAPCKHE